MSFLNIILRYYYLVLGLLPWVTPLFICYVAGQALLTLAAIENGDKRMTIERFVTFLVKLLSRVYYSPIVNCFEILSTSIRMGITTISLWYFHDFLINLANGSVGDVVITLLYTEMVEISIPYMLTISAISPFSIRFRAFSLIPILFLACVELAGYFALHLSEKFQISKWTLFLFCTAYTVKILYQIYQLGFSTAYTHLKKIQEFKKLLDYDHTAYGSVNAIKLVKYDMKRMYLNDRMPVTDELHQDNIVCRDVSGIDRDKASPLDLEEVDNQQIPFRPFMEVTIDDLTYARDYANHASLLRLKVSLTLNIEDLIIESIFEPYVLPDQITILKDSKRDFSPEIAEFDDLRSSMFHNGPARYFSQLSEVIETTVNFHKPNSGKFFDSTLFCSFRFLYVSKEMVANVSNSKIMGDWLDPVQAYKEIQHAVNVSSTVAVNRYLSMRQVSVHNDTILYLKHSFDARRSSRPDQDFRLQGQC